MGFFDGGWFGGGSETTAGGSLGDTSRYSLTGEAPAIPDSSFSAAGQAKGVPSPYALDGPGLQADPKLVEGLDPGFSHLDDRKLAQMREDDAEAKRKADMAKLMFAQMFTTLAKAGADAYTAHALRGKSQGGYQVVQNGGGQTPQITVDNPLAGMNLG